MSQEQLDLIATMEEQLAQTDATLAQLKATITGTDPEPPLPPSVVWVETEADLDAALTAAQPGDVLSLSCDLVYSRYFTLAQSVVLEADSLPPGRMTRDPKLPTFLAGLKVAANNATLRGIEIRHTDPLTNICIVSGENVTLDRVRMLGDPVLGAKRGMSGDAVNLVVSQCYIDDCFGTHPGPDTQAILITETPGPVLIEDCYLCAGSETIMIGGDDPASEATMPSHITIRGCTITANPKWQAEMVNVKSRLELKNARNVVVEDCIIEQCWGGHGQDGYLLALTVRNQYGTAPFSTIQDVSIRRNTFSHGAGAITILGNDDNYESTPMANVEIVDNVFEDLNPTTYSGSVKMILVGRGPKATTIARNHFTGDGHTSTLYFHSPTPMCEDFNVVENTWPETNYGIFGSDTPSGISAWDYNVASGSCEGNVVIED